MSLHDLINKNQKNKIEAAKEQAKVAIDKAADNLLKQIIENEESYAPSFCLPDSELVKTQTAIYADADQLEAVTKFLDNATNGQQKIKYEIVEQNGVKNIVTHLWKETQVTPLDGSYCFLSNAGDTYPIRRAEFEETYQVIDSIPNSPVVQTKKQQKIIKALEIVPELEGEILKLLRDSSYDKSKYQNAGHIDKTTNPWTLVINTLEGTQRLPFYVPTQGADINSPEELKRRTVLIQGVSQELYHNQYNKFRKTYIPYIPQNNYDIEDEELTVISEEEWDQVLSEEHIDPDYWCDENPADYGYFVEGVSPEEDRPANQKKKSI